MTFFDSLFSKEPVPENVAKAEKKARKGIYVRGKHANIKLKGSKEPFISKSSVMDNTATTMKLNGSSKRTKEEAEQLLREVLSRL